MSYQAENLEHMDHKSHVLLVWNILDLSEVQWIFLLLWPVLHIFLLVQEN